MTAPFFMIFPRIFRIFITGNQLPELISWHESLKINVMRIHLFFSFPVMFTLMISILITVNSFQSFAQDQMAMATGTEQQVKMNWPERALTQTLNDTVLPTICNCGKGLLHVDCTLLSENEKVNQLNTSLCKSHLSLIQNLTESEINTLIMQERFIERQAVIQIQKQILDDKIDLQLGELIKGIYMQPPF